MKQINSLVQDCSNSIAYALELLQSCTKPSKYTMPIFIHFTSRRTDLKFIWSFYKQILAKIELICQQPTMPQVSGAQPSSGVPERMAGGSQGGLAMSLP